MSVHVDQLGIAVDPVTRERIRGSLQIERDGSIEIRLPHKLESPNAKLHAHWRERHREKQAWHARLLLVIGDAAGKRSVAAYHRPLDALNLPPVRAKRIVRFDRQVSSSRSFIRDHENLVYSVKHCLDQVKKLGFICDDSMKWIDLVVTQRVSDDRRDWTVIRIEVPPGASMPLR